MSGQLHSPAALTTEQEPPVPIRWEVTWNPEPFWGIWKGNLFCREGNSSTSVNQRVASSYRVCSVGAGSNEINFQIFSTSELDAKDQPDATAALYPEGQYWT
jgi:hypothetical protein